MEAIVIGTWRFTASLSIDEVKRIAEVWSEDPNYLQVVTHQGKNDAGRISFFLRLERDDEEAFEGFFHRTNQWLIERLGLDQDALTHGDVRRAQGVKGWSITNKVHIHKEGKLT